MTYNAIYLRNRNGQYWSDWGEFVCNIPSFYKNYADLNSLSSALGVNVAEIAYHIYQPGDTDSPSSGDDMAVGFIIREGNELIEIAVSSSLNLYARGRWGATYGQWVQLN
jgi:hypothetical protein